MIRHINHYNDYSISPELPAQYQLMPAEQRLEWPYLGNVARKLYCDAADKEMISGALSMEGKP